MGGGRAARRGRQHQGHEGKGVLGEDEGSERRKRVRRMQPDGRVEQVRSGTSKGAIKPSGA